MPATTSPAPPSEPRDVLDSRRSRLLGALERAALVLPAQGPIAVFIHHNTLHAFEHLPFDEAVQEGARLLGCQPYRTEDRYRDDLRRGRIRASELREVLENDLGPGAREPIPGPGSRLDLRLAMLEYPLLDGPTEELLWYMAEADAFRKVRPEVSSALGARMIAETRRWVVRDRDRIRERLGDLSPGVGGRSSEDWSDEQWEGFTLRALWRACRDGVRDVPHFTSPPPPPARHRDLLLRATGADPDSLVHDLLIRIVAAFLDQGLAYWPMPGRDLGFYRGFLALFGGRGLPADRWRAGIEGELRRLSAGGIGPLDSAIESLEILGVLEGEWEPFLASTLLALRGWGGMIREVEARADRVVRPIPEGSLVEFLAVRLILDRFALAHLAREAMNYRGPLDGLRDLLRSRVEPAWPPSVERRAFLIFQFVQLFGLSPDALGRLGPDDWRVLVREVESFSGIERRRVFHLAYEKRLATQALDAIALRADGRRGRPPSPEFQAVCCLDEREESFRRHLEEVAPGVETFGVAGFFGVAMYYRGAADANFVPLCPVAVRPGHWAVEEEAEAGRRRTGLGVRRALGAASDRLRVASRGVALGAFLTGAVGVFASFPSVGRILFPRAAARARKLFGKMARRPPRTRLRLERDDPAPGADDARPGFSVGEMTDIAERFLGEIGLRSGFARLVVLIGHGSTSQNNPHLSAYNCGACGGSAGGPNARALAQMLSDSRVRDGLASRGLPVPLGTVFVGAEHNTCDDSVVYYDLDSVPESHAEGFESARLALLRASERNAHERCRRFVSAPLTISPEEALEHVEERSQDLAQTRPELGHATNAIAIVGRRERTRGLFLDRRAFLVSYDPAGDPPDCPTLTRILRAVFPVCAGINLEYYFSSVDNAGFGAGSKLPHNLAAMVGVMDGAGSDLRTGLPWQMVEIHEPVRSLFLIETTPGAMAGIMDRDPSIGRLCRNGWVQLAVLDPDSGRISVFEGGEFRAYEPRASTIPSAPSSADWYRGWRDHLEFAEIGPS